MITRTKEEDHKSVQRRRRRRRKKEGAWYLISAAPLLRWGLQQRLRVLLQPTLRLHLLLGG